MISRIITCLTVFAVLGHSILGCCWHHGHACADGSDGEHHALPTSLGGGCSHSERDQPGAIAVSGHDDEPGHHNPCDEPDCTYLAVKVTPIGTAPVAPGWTATRTQTLTAMGDRRLAVELSVRTAAELPPETMRALHQVWLL